MGLKDVRLGENREAKSIWRFWEVWRVRCLVGASTRLEARGLGGLSSGEPEFSAGVPEVN